MRINIAKFAQYLSIFLSLSILGCSGNIHSLADKDLMKNGIFKFPEGFLWGTATASYQVEGGNINDWSTTGLDAGKASSHYELYDQDFSLTKNLGNNVHRFSIEWSRIEPEQGKFDLKEVEHYRDVLKSLKKYGLKSMVTLQHFTNPLWISKMGGWENPEVVGHFTNYVRFIVNEFQGDVDFWITINEPNVYAFKAYDEGIWPPYKKDRKLALQVIKNELIAHAEAYRAIHEIDKNDADSDGKNALVGIAHHIALLHPESLITPLDSIQTYFQSKVFNYGIWDAVSTGVIEFYIPGVISIKEPYNKKLHGSMDFVGVNYYTRWLVNYSGERRAKPASELNDLGWEIYPDGMLEALRMANTYASKLNIPIYITENGIDDGSDKKRAKFLLSHLTRVAEAIKEGIPVKGYIHWTLMDNYEWAEKFNAKFGFYTIDRKLRDSGNLYREICKQNAITESMF